MKKKTYMTRPQIFDSERPFVRMMFVGKKSIQLRETSKRNPFWIDKETHLCGKCKHNDQVKTDERFCLSCGVEFIWL